MRFFGSNKSDQQRIRNFGKFKVSSSISRKDAENTHLLHFSKLTLDTTPEHALHQIRACENPDVGMIIMVSEPFRMPKSWEVFHSTSGGTGIQISDNFVVSS